MSKCLPHIVYVGQDDLFPLLFTPKQAFHNVDPNMANQICRSRWPRLPQEQDKGRKYQPVPDKPFDKETTSVIRLAPIRTPLSPTLPHHIEQAAMPATTK